MLIDRDNGKAESLNVSARLPEVLGSLPPKDFRADYALLVRSWDSATRDSAFAGWSASLTICASFLVEHRRWRQLLSSNLAAHSSNWSPANCLNHRLARSGSMVEELVVKSILRTSGSWTFPIRRRVSTHRDRRDHSVRRSQVAGSGSRCVHGAGPVWMGPRERWNPKFDDTVAQVRT